VVGWQPPTPGCGPGVGVRAPWCGWDAPGRAPWPGVWLREAPRPLPWVPWPAAGSPGAAGDPRRGGGHRLPSLPSRRPLHWGGERGTGCQVPPGTAGRVPGLLGGGGGLQGPPGRAASAARGGGTRELLPALPGRRLRRTPGPGTTGRNRFGRPGERLSRSAGVELGTADAGVLPAHPAPRSWRRVTGTGVCSCGAPGSVGSPQGWARLGFGARWRGAPLPREPGPGWPAVPTLSPSRSGAGWDGWGSAPWRGAARGAQPVPGFTLSGWRGSVFRADVGRRRCPGCCPPPADTRCPCPRR